MGWKSPERGSKRTREVEQLLEHIRERGAVRAADFERTDGKAGGWWEWKTEKRALEALSLPGNDDRAP